MPKAPEICLSSAQVRILGEGSKREVSSQGCTVLSVDLGWYMTNSFVQRVLQIKLGLLEMAYLENGLMAMDM